MKSSLPRHPLPKVRLAKRAVTIGALPLALLVLAGCSSKETAGPSGGGGNGESSSSSESINTSSVSGAGGAGASGPKSGPGCGFAVAAFCDTFEAPSQSGGRAGELDAASWSAGRVAPQGPTGHGGVFPVGSAMIPSCRPGLPTMVLPDQDALICDPNDDVESHHLMIAVAAQNYGLNSYRVRNAFDFDGRTGTIAFDGTVSPYGGLFGWLSIEVTEDPIAVPAFAVLVNYEGGVLPKNAVEIQLDGGCGPNTVGVSAIHVFDGYVDHGYKVASPMCTVFQDGKLNHFEVQISQSKVKVFASPPSADGVTFGEPMLLAEADVDLPFKRGYVHLTVHNHATLKYSGSSAGFGVPEKVDASVARIDNFGFDGPVIASGREYEIPDALAPVDPSYATDPFTPKDPYDPGHALSMGYLTPDVGDGRSQPLVFHGVDPTGVVGARLALTAYYVPGPSVAQYTLKFRLNGGPWHVRPLDADEIQNFAGPMVSGFDNATPAILGAVGQMIDLPLDELVTGDNTLELATANVPQGYPPAVANVDLVLGTN